MDDKTIVDRLLAVTRRKAAAVDLTVPEYMAGILDGRLPLVTAAELSAEPADGKGDGVGDGTETAGP